MSGEQYTDRERAFAREVQRLREDRSWTLAEMAEALQREGIDYASTMTVSRTEKLQRPVRMIEAIAYGRIFDRTVYELSEPDAHADLLDRAMKDVRTFREHLAQARSLEHRMAKDLEEMKHWLNMINQIYTPSYVASLSPSALRRWESAMDQLESEVSEVDSGEHPTAS